MIMIKRFRCSHCEKTFRDQEELKSHEKTHGGTIKLKMPTFTKKQLPAIFIAFIFLGSTIGFVYHLFPQGLGGHDSVDLGGIDSSGAPTQIGSVGSTHHHGTLDIIINGQRMDLHSYMLRSPLTHFEDNDDREVHVHATGVTLGFFLRTLGMDLTSECFHGPQESYCGEGLRFTVNGAQNSNFGNHLILEGDEMIIEYSS